jgi:ribonucleoside-diphosphate reductase beta chain
MADIQLNDPQSLYERWEGSQWSPFAIDLSTDSTHWQAMGGAERELIFYVLSSLMVAEERITTKFSGLVGAHGSEEEATFLATQQVDEARHMQFYARFQDEVVAAPEAIAAHVSRARTHLSDAFREIFDVALVAAHERLVAEPASLAAKVRFVTLYHLVLEGTLGLTTFKFTTDHLTRERLLPGFLEGYGRIHHDETRHIGYGVWFLREQVRSRPQTAEVIREMLRELLPSVAASLAPPETTSSLAFEAIGADSEQVRSFALAGLTRRLEIIGVPLGSL